MSRKMSYEEATALLNKSTVSDPGINLQPGEVCYFASYATGVIAENQVVGATYSSFGTGAFSSKYGIGIHSDRGVKTNIRGTVVDTYEGHLYLTSRRIILVAYKGGFDILLEQLTALDFYSDGLMVTSNGQSYYVGLKKVRKFMKLIKASNVVQSAQNNVPPISRPATASQPIPPISRQNPPVNQQAPVSQQNPPAGQQAPVSQPNPAVNQPAPENSNLNSGTESKKSKKQPVALWVVFIVCLLFAIFSLTGSYNKLKFFVFFGSIALGCALHLDPLKLREKNNLLPVGVTWMICAALAIIGLVLL